MASSIYAPYLILIGGTLAIVVANGDALAIINLAHFQL